MALSAKMVFGECGVSEMCVTLMKTIGAKTGSPLYLWSTFSRANHYIADHLPNYLHFFCIYQL